MDVEDYVVREAIQNSVDAASKVDKGVTVEFSELLLQSEFKTDILQALGINDSLAERAAAAETDSEQGDRIAADCWRSILDPDEPLSILHIEDFGGPGLRGGFQKEHFRSSWWRMFVHEHGITGQGSKPDQGGGGSHGKGRIAMSQSSKLFMIVIYTEVEEAQAPESPSYAMLGGVLFIPSHTIGGRDFTGKAFLCAEQRVNPESNQPLLGEDARSLAKLLRFRRATDWGNAHGLSIAVMMPKVTLDEIKKATEKNWWPRIEGHVPGKDLNVAFYDRYSHRIDIDYSGQECIYDFIECWKSIREIEDSDRVELSILTSKAHPKPLGTVAVMKVEEDAMEDSSDSLKWRDPNTVALIRNHGMVINYENPVGGTPCRAVFVLDDSLVDLARRAENVGHSKWHGGGLPKNEQLIIDALHRGLRRKIRSLTQPEDDDEVPISTARLLDEVWGRKLATRRLGTKPSPPPGGSDDWSIHKDNTSATIEGTIVERIDDFSIGLRDDANPQEITIESKFYYLRDVNGVREISKGGGSLSDPRPLVRVIGKDNETSAAWAEVSSKLKLFLKPGRRIAFQTKVTYVDPESYTDVELIVKKVGDDAKKEA